MPGTHNGVALGASAGLKVNFGGFYLFPKVLVSYFAPQGGQWIRPGSGGLVGSYLLAEEEAFGGDGLGIGFQF